MKRTIFLIILLFSILCVPVCAEEYEYDLNDETNIYQEFYDASDTDKLVDSTPDEAKEFLYDLNVTPSNPFSYESLTSKQALQNIIDYILDYIMSPLKAAAILMTAILICGLISCIGGEGSSQTQKTINIAAALICTVSIALPVTNLITKGVNVITACSGFMLSFVPIFASILIAALRTKTSLGFQPVVFFSAQAVAYIARNIVSPFTSMYLAVAVAGSVTEGTQLKGFSEILKKVAIWVITAAMTIYMAIISIQTAITSTADSATNKTAKFFVTSVVPIVGASVSDALGSMKSCVSIIKTSVAIYAVMVIAILIVPLIIEILFWRLMLMFCSTAAQMFLLDNIKVVTEAISSALSILLSVVICVGIMFIFSITIVTMAGGSV